MIAIFSGFIGVQDAFATPSDYEYHAPRHINPLFPDPFVDAFPEYRFVIYDFKEDGPAKLKIEFHYPILITNGTNGFEVLKNDNPVDFNVKKAKNLFIKVQLKDGTFGQQNNSYTINYDGSSNNLQMNGKSIPSFSLQKAKHYNLFGWKPISPPTSIFFTENNSISINGTFIEGDTFEFPEWYIQDVNAFSYSSVFNYYDNEGAIIASDYWLPLKEGEYSAQLRLTNTWLPPVRTLDFYFTVLPEPDTTLPVFEVEKNGKIYSEPEFFTFQNSTDVIQGKIINIVDESSTVQSITSTLMSNGHVTNIFYKVTDADGNTSQISEMVFLDNEYENEGYRFSVMDMNNNQQNPNITPQWSDFTVTLPDDKPVDLIWEIDEIIPINERPISLIVTSKDAKYSNSIFYVDYILYWQPGGYFYHITQEIISSSLDDIDEDGLLMSDRCKLRAGPVENFGCPSSDMLTR